MAKFWEKNFKVARRKEKSIEKGIKGKIKRLERKPIKGNWEKVFKIKGKTIIWAAKVGKKNFSKNQLKFSFSKIFLKKSFLTFALKQR